MQIIFKKWYLSPLLAVLAALLTPSKTDRQVATPKACPDEYRQEFSRLTFCLWCKIQAYQTSLWKNIFFSVNNAYNFVWNGYAETV